MVSNSIIDSCKQGKRKAHKLCYELCAPYIYTIVKSYIYDHELRKDAMQEVFAHIFNSIESYDLKKGSFKSWIGSIAVYQSIAVLKSVKKLNVMVPLEDIAMEFQIEEVKVDQLSKEDLELLLKKMPDGYRTVFLLSVIDGYSHQEIAQLLQIDVGTSRSQLSRAIKWINKNIPVQTKKIIYG